MLIQSMSNDLPESMQGVTGDQVARITLKVRDMDGIEVRYRVKRSTPLKKLMIAYCNRQSIVFNATVFLFNGAHVQACQTPDELQMEEGDGMDAIPRRLEELRLYLDQLIAGYLVLKEKLIKLRKDAEELRKELTRLTQKQIRLQKIQRN
ncbi:hypothetical protein QVD17_14072 [Tagetes erecta]|uniref:Ubiquitin-like domain-containing protein n=1 Tax=Tagetes erecta TaxID=13708 RepID=A0AAD8P3R3_TARER|nr:hypothetical protein QVD17_14072 [Tagetes erecta]